MTNTDVFQKLLKYCDSFQDLISSEILNVVYEEEDAITRGKRKAELIIKAKEFNADKEMTAFLKLLDREEKKEACKWKAEKNELNNINLQYTDKNVPAVTVKNFLEILKKDEHFKDVKFNEMTYNPEYNGEPWKDRHSSEVVAYIEEKYGLKSEKDMRHALNLVWNERRYHPIRDIVKSIKWDGKNRIENFLTEILKTENTEYAKECSRLIFHCGISRIFNPGCKVDDIVVLQGLQGGGKSSVIEWLSLKYDYYTVISNIEGRDGMEALKGKWICEIGELIAVTKLKEQEAAKAYFTKQSDNYRRPYAEFPEDIPRQCIFIGTTNRRECFTDKTGNRRYYPIWCDAVGFDIYDRKEEIQEYIRQCWAEAYHLWQEGKIKHSVNAKLINTIRERQNSALEDDPTKGLILDYTEKEEVDEICLMMVWQEALKNDYSKPTKKERSEITDIMESLDGWHREKNPKHFHKYGTQRYWARNKVEKKPLDDDDLDF